MSLSNRANRAERRLTRLIDRRVTTPQAQPLVRRYSKHRHHLLVLLRDPTVHSHNKNCVRSLRPAVVHRKVIGGCRSDWGAQAYATLTSVLDNAKLHGQSVFATLVTLMGKPVLPYLTASEPRAVTASTARLKWAER